MQGWAQVGAKVGRKETDKWNLDDDITSDKGKNTFIDTVKEFCESTSIHGLKYITEPGSHWVERCFWIALVVIGLAFEVQLLMPIIEKYQNTKTITTVDTTNHPIWNIDFPGITVCSNIRVSNSLFKSALSNSKLPWINLTEYEQSDGLGQIITNLVKFQSDPDLLFFTDDSREVLKNYSDHITPLMAMITPSCSRMFLYCKWQGKRVDCDKVVKQRKTDDGFCCSFNTIDLAESYALSEEDFEEEDTFGGCSTDSYTYSSSTESSFNTSETANSTSTNSSGYDYGSYNYNYGCYSMLSGSDSDSIARYETDPDNLCLIPTTTTSTPTSTSTSESTPTSTSISTSNSTSTSTASISSNALNSINSEYDSSTTSTTKSEDDDALFKGTHIYRTNGASKTLGFSFFLDPVLNDEFSNLFDEFLTSNFFHGFKVLVHSPYEFPEVSKKGIAVGVGQEVFIGVSAEVIESTPTVLTMSPEDRSCLDESETKYEPLGVDLYAFQNYTKSNCLLECRAAAMLKTCKCLIYFFPELPNAFIKQYMPEYNSSKDIICNSDQLKCLAENSASMSALSDGELGAKYDMVEGLDCNCPDNCNEVIYSQEISTGPFQDTNHFFWKHAIGECYTPCAPHKQFKKEKEALEKKYETSCTEKTLKKKIKDSSLVHVYFKNLGVTKFTKDRLFGWADLISQFGGGVGLCVGFSLLSGAEIIYFFTIRIFFRRNRATRN